MPELSSTSTIEVVKVRFDPYERKMLRWLLMAASRDQTRESLCFTINITETAIFSSDGWRLHAIPLLEAFRPFIGMSLRAAKPISELARTMEFEIVGQSTHKLRSVLPQRDADAMIVVDAVALKKAISGYGEAIEIAIFLPEGPERTSEYMLEVRSRSGLGQYALIMGKVDNLSRTKDGYKPSV